MSDLHRIFIAVELDPALHQAVIDTQQRLESAGAKVRWIKSHGLHFTLRFLGEISMAQVARVRLATREAASGVQPFSITLRSLGAFPSLQRPQVVWIGVDEGREPLEAVAERLDGVLAHHRFPRERRKFRPHLTLARVRDSRQWGDLVRALAQFKDVEVGSQRVEALTVMESQLMPQGPLYTRVEEVSLSPYEK